MVFDQRGVTVQCIEQTLKKWFIIRGAEFSLNFVSRGLNLRK